MVAWVFLYSLYTCCCCQENSLNPRSTAINSRGDADLTIRMNISFESSRRFTYNVTLNLHRKIRKRCKCRLLNMLSASRVKVWIHFIWQRRQTDTLECIYTTRIEAWTVDDWTRDTTVHLNHHDLGVLCLFQQRQKKKKKKKKKKRKKKSHFEIIERGVWSGIHCLQKQFSHFSRNNQIS